MQQSDRRRILISLLLAILAPFGLAAVASAEKPGPGADLEDVYLWLHANPELSLKEVNSSALMAAELETLGFEVTTRLGDDYVKQKAMAEQGVVRDQVGGYGVVGVLRNGEGPTVMIRADMDALPLIERTGKDYASTKRGETWTGVENGVMHACGHDIHMTSWIGTARRLVAEKDAWSGTLVMIAQPAEEIGLGAVAMISDGLFSRFPTPDYNIALHVDSSRPAGVVSFLGGFTYANVDSVDITVFGTGGHGAYPNLSKDPIVAASSMVTALQTLVSRTVDPQRPAVVTVGSFQAGAKHNIIPDQAKLLLTVRSYDDTTPAGRLEST
ncbi:MAG: amidohydrolase, partial [Pseudomonadota bacterium]